VDGLHRGGAEERVATLGMPAELGAIAGTGGRFEGDAASPPGSTFSQRGIQRANNRVPRHAAGNRERPSPSWTKPRMTRSMPLLIQLANKLARIAFAVFVLGRDYEPRTTPNAA
jgi:hypothetical protein